MARSWTFGKKIAAGFAAVVVLSILISAIAAYALKTVVASKDRVIDVNARNLVDAEKLRASMGDYVDERPERYSFSWAGKRDAIRLLQVPSRASLIPARDESLDFDTTQNISVDGDNLEVLKLLYKPYFGRVKMIYIDPPYNTGNDFVYPDNFADPLDTYLKLTGQKDSQGNLLTSNPETGGRYHSAWLSMMYPRLFLARQLLREDGVIFVSIDDHEVHNLRLLMNEIFGEENFVASVMWQKMYSGKADATHFGIFHEYILCYAKNILTAETYLLPRTEEMNARYSNPDNDPRGPWLSNDLTASGERSGGHYPVVAPLGKTFDSPQGKHWLYARHTMDELVRDNGIWFGKDGNAFPRLKRFLSDVQQGRRANTVWLYDEVGHTDEATKEVKDLFPENTELFETPKPSRLIKRMVQITTTSGDNNIVLDFFAGSCTTAQAVLELNRADGGNRHFIMVQLPEPTGNKQFPTIAEIGKERIRRVVARMKKGTRWSTGARQTRRSGLQGLQAGRLQLQTMARRPEGSPRPFGSGEAGRAVRRSSGGGLAAGKRDL